MMQEENTYGILPGFVKTAEAGSINGWNDPIEQWLLGKGS
jgi:hypothetical protein